MTENLLNAFETFKKNKFSDTEVVQGAFFYDKDKKKLIYIYNDVIVDEFKNEYVGYRDIVDVISNKEHDSIVIVPIGRLDKRVLSGRLLPIAPDLSNLRDMLDTAYRFGTVPGIIQVFNNYKSIIDHCGESLFTGLFRK